MHRGIEIAAWWVRCALLLVICLPVPIAMAEDARPLRGVALVIGQSAYENLPRLANPANDAREIDRLLSDLGFDVDTVLDGDRRRLERAIQRFAEDAADADVGLVYYAGHGVEAGGENFLVPVDAGLPASGGTVDDLVAVGAMLAELQRTAPIAIVLLDACRDNPYPPGTLVAGEGGNPQTVSASGLGEPRGAAPLRDDGPETLGAVIGFAAEPGKAALDGEPGTGSPYSAALIKHLGAGGHAFGDVMTMVAEEVYLETSSRQLPWTNASLRRLLYFGRNAEEKSGDEQAIRDGRRALLLTIATTPAETRRLVEDVAAANAVPLDALYGMLGVLGVDTASGDVAQHLSEGAARLQSILASRDAQTRQDPEIVRLASLADRAEGEGAIALALEFRGRASARADDIDRALDEAEANIAGRRLELAATYRSHAETATLNFDFATAAARYADAFAQAERWDVPLAYELKVLEANALADHGVYVGDNRALEKSLAAYEKALDVGRASANARRDASLKGNMAIVMTELGARSTDTAWLDRAAELYGEVAAALPRSRYPQDWAYTQLNLGSLYHTLGDRTGAREYLDMSLKAYRDAAKVLTKKAAPEQWAGLQMNIGNVQATLGERGGGAKALRESVKSMEAALSVWTREAYPVNFGLAQANLGTALATLGGIEKNPSMLRRAIAAHQAALEIATRERQPASWASGMSNLGSAFLELAELEGDESLYAEAIEAYRGARTVLTLEVDPNSFASTHYNEGRALLMLGRREASLVRLGEAEASLEAAIEVLASSPIGWARGRSVLGEILAEKGRLAGDRQALLAARNAFEDARRAYAENGMGETGQGFWEKQIAAIDKELGR